MKVTLNLNPDEALALVQVLERDQVFTDVTEPVIHELERMRQKYFTLRRESTSQQLAAQFIAMPINPDDADAWNRWADKHRVNLRLETSEDTSECPGCDYPMFDCRCDKPESNVYLLDGRDNLIDITETVLKGE